MFRHRWQFVLGNGLRYLKVHQSSNKDRPTLQFVLPEAFQKQALQACHKAIGHLGKECSLKLLRDRFYWPNLASNIETHIHQCDHCQRFKAKPQRAELPPVKVTHPLELVHMDFLTVELGEKTKNINILVVTDHFTKYSQTCVTSSQTAQVVVKTLQESFSCIMACQRNY